MSTSALLKHVEASTVLEPLADALQASLRNLFDNSGDAAAAIRDVLHGTWLGHPLHAMLTDAPIGFFTTGFCFDLYEALAGDERLARASDSTLLLGILSAFATAATGLTDWKETSGNARKIGITHGLINTFATSLFVAAWLSRKRKDRTMRLGLAFAGNAVLTLGAYLGGVLVYDHQIGVNHAHGEELGKEWLPALPDEELSEGKAECVKIEGRGEYLMRYFPDVLIVKSEGKLLAIANRCSHLGGPLNEGEIEGLTVTCPWHKSCFSLVDGSNIHGPSVFDQPCYETRVRKGIIEVRGA